jgi:hypothetical protein
MRRRSAAISILFDLSLFYLIAMQYGHASMTCKDAVRNFNNVFKITRNIYGMFKFGFVK